MIRYRISKCYEVIIEDDDGNEIFEPEYIYTTYHDAKIRAEEMVQEAELAHKTHDVGGE